MKRSTAWPLLVLLAGCATAEVMHLDNTARPARAPEQVQFFLEAPDSAYTPIAIITVSDKAWGLSLDKLRKKLVEEAAKLGGDAVILSSRSNSTNTYLMPVGNQYMSVPMTEKELAGQVIVFKH